MKGETESENSHDCTETQTGRQFVKDLKAVDKYGDISRLAFLLHYVDSHQPVDDQDRAYICKHLRSSISSAMESLSILLTDDDRTVREYCESLKRSMDTLLIGSLFTSDGKSRSF